VSRRWLGVLLAWGLALSSLRARASTIYFSYADAQYLRPSQQRGGAALLPDEPSSAPLPVVVFLHGTNPSGALHLWLGGGGRDLRPLAQRLMSDEQVGSFVLAAPSQTKNARLAHSLWSGFDLAAFVSDLSRALDGQVALDPARVLLVGHSGAGCNPRGGLAYLAGRSKKPALLPLGLVSIDPCLNAEMGRALAGRPARVPLSVLWQAAIWQRAPQAFWRALDELRPPERVDRMTQLRARGANPHRAIVPPAFEQAVREWLGEPLSAPPTEEPRASLD
jgi:hypothetical protein